MSVWRASKMWSARQLQYLDLLPIWTAPNISNSLLKPGKSSTNTTPLHIIIHSPVSSHCHERNDNVQGISELPPRVRPPQPTTHDPRPATRDPQLVAFLGRGGISDCHIICSYLLGIIRLSQATAVANCARLSLRCIHDDWHGLQNAHVF